MKGALQRLLSGISAATRVTGRRGQAFQIRVFWHRLGEQGYASDPEVAKYVTWEPHRTIADSRVFLHDMLERYEKRMPANWGLVLKATGQLVGTCGFMSWFPTHGRAEIGFALGRRYWGQGLMTEAIRQVVLWGFGECSLNRIEGECKPENVASARVMEKCGMTFEGVLRQSVYAKGQYHDVRLYSVLRQEQQGSAGEC